MLFGFLFQIVLPSSGQEVLNYPEFDFVGADYQQEHFRIVPVGDGQFMSTVMNGLIENDGSAKASNYAEKTIALHFGKGVSLDAKILDTAYLGRFQNLEVISVFPTSYELNDRRKQMYDENLKRLARLLPKLTKLHSVKVLHGNATLYDTLSKLENLTNLYIQFPHAPIPNEKGNWLSLSKFYYSGPVEYFSSVEMKSLKVLSVYLSGTSETISASLPVENKIEHFDFGGCLSDIDFQIFHSGHLTYLHLFQTFLRTTDLGKPSFDLGNIPSLKTLRLNVTDKIVWPDMDGVKNVETLVIEYPTSSLIDSSMQLEFPYFIKGFKKMAKFHLDYPGRWPTKKILPKSVQKLSLNYNSRYALDLNCLRNQKQLHYLSLTTFWTSLNDSVKVVKGDRWMKHLPDSSVIDLQHFYDLKHLDQVITSKTSNLLMLNIYQAENHSEAFYQNTTKKRLYIGLPQVKGSPYVKGETENRALAQFGRRDAITKKFETELNHFEMISQQRSNEETSALKSFF